MSAASELRQAAETLRDRAEASTPGPWFTDAAGSDGVYTEAHVSRTSEDVAFASGLATNVSATEVYIATMHPGVGLALAEWLDEIRLTWEIAENMVDPDGDPLAFDQSIDSHALTVARLINGGAS